MCSRPPQLRPGRYQTVADNLRVKDVLVGDGDARRRYIICHNPQEAALTKLDATRRSPGSPARSPS